MASGTYAKLHETCPEFNQWTQTTTQNIRTDSTSVLDSNSQWNVTVVPQYLPQLSVTLIDFRKLLSKEVLFSFL